MCLCVHVRVRALHLEDDVGFRGLGGQRQHVSSHGLRVQTVPEIASVGGDLCRQEQIKAQTQTEHHAAYRLMKHKARPAVYLRQIKPARLLRACRLQQAAI